MRTALKVAVVGAGPAGMALALLAARWLPFDTITVFDARAADRDIAADPRTLALSLGSVQLLQQLGAWPAQQAQPITQVRVSQSPPSGDAAEVCLHAADEGVALLGAVLSYGTLVSALQRAWLAEVAREPRRLGLRLSAPVSSVSARLDGVRVEVAGAAAGVDVAGPAGEGEAFDLAVIAEGGVFAEQSRKAIAHDYAQTAWVGSAQLEGAPEATAFERFTRDGPLALLPLPPVGEERCGVRRAAIVWCVARDDDPVRELSDEQRIVLVQSLLPPAAGRLLALSTLKPFELGLNAERRLVQGRRVRIGNAAQTLHPVAGQGLNLALRDVHDLVLRLRDAGGVDRALRAFERARTADRWSTLAITDFLARSFTWRAPLVAPLRSAGLAALQAAEPLKSLLARHMMFGIR